VAGTVLHLTTRAEWDAARVAGTYEPTGFAAEGFVHCSTPGQVVAVANRFYRGAGDCVLLEVDPGATGAELRWEPGADRPDEMFPHLYGRIPVPAVVAVHAFPEGDDGWTALPPTVTPAP
jgi:uncharacterized protein (DUF952 family)